MTITIPSTLPKPTMPEKKSGYHHGNLRNSIINAVAQLIGEKKSLNFKLKELAKMVGTTQPAVYKHFKNKADLLVETAVKGYELQRSFRTYALEQAGDSPLSKILAIANAYFYFSRIHTGFFILMKNLETQEILSSKRYQEQREKTIILVLDLIRQCQQQGIFLKEEPKIIFTTLQSTAYGLAHSYISGQIAYNAGELSNEPGLPSIIMKHGIRAFLTKPGEKQLMTIQDVEFTESELNT